MSVARMARNAPSLRATCVLFALSFVGMLACGGTQATGDDTTRVDGGGGGDGVIGPPTITRAAAGQGQRAEVLTAVPIPPRVLVTDADGDPVPGVRMTFTVREGEGSADGIDVVTGPDGQASVGSWRLGPIPGRNVLIGEVPGLAPVEFVAEGTPGENGSMTIATGNHQYARIGQAVQVPPAVVVRDRDDKPVPGRRVTFRIGSGGGVVEGADATTDADGIARVGRFQVGTTPGENTLIAETDRLPPLTIRATAVSDQEPVLARESVVSGLTNPWDIAFAPDGAMLYSLQAGTVWVRPPGATEFRRLVQRPADLDTQTQSGLLGIALDPAFGSQRYLYVYMSSNRGGAIDNRVRRYLVSADWSSATEDRDIVTGISWGSAGGHSGGRIRFGPDGALWITTGDTRSATVPQSLSALGGKVLRVTRDGAAAPGNPGLGPNGIIYAYGFRNPQGIAFRPGDGAPFLCEHGPNQDDEVTRLLPGGNGGWNPNDGNGNYNGYSGAKMTDVERFPNALRPGLVIADSEGMSGCDFVSGTPWRSWDGRLAVGMLAGRRLVTALFNTAGTGTLAPPTNALTNIARLRSVVRGPDGHLYIAVNGLAPNDAIWRVRAE